MKERLTVLLCTNSDGSDKRVPIIIRKSAKPRCFKNVKKLPVTYYANSKAWMTSEIFRDFLHALDASFGELGRKILLFVDNCSAHSPDILSEEYRGGFFLFPELHQCHTATCFGRDQVLQAGVQEAASAEGCMFDGRRERGTTED